MTPTEALALVEDLCKRISMPHEQHVLAQTAIAILRKEIDPAKPKPPAKK